MHSARGVKTVRLHRRKSGLDFSVKGGHGHGIPVVVSWIKENGAAAEVLHLGDEVLAVNGRPLQGLTHEEAVQRLRDLPEPLVSLRVRPNHTLEDIFSSKTETEQERPPPGQPGGHTLPAVSSSPPSAVASTPEVCQPGTAPAAPCSGPLPRGWTQKTDHKTGRPYFENHHTSSSTWTDPCSLQPCSLEQHDWSALPPSWGRFLDQHGDIYYVDHDTQTTHWDSPRGARQQRQLDELSSFLRGQTERLSEGRAELAERRDLLLDKNCLLATLNTTPPQEVGGAENCEGRAEGISPADLMDDIMVLNEEVEALDGRVGSLQEQTGAIANILRSGHYQDLGGGAEQGAGHGESAGLALRLSNTYGRLKSLERQLHELIASLETLRKESGFSDAPLQYTMQLPPLTERSEVEERRAWLHVLPDRLTGKTCCEMRVELLLLETSCLAGEGLLRGLSNLHEGARSQPIRWERLLDELASFDFSPLEDQWLGASFREKLERVMSLD